MLSAKGYPGNYKKGNEIKLDKLKDIEGINIFHAGTKQEGEKLLSNGGRVLNITAVGSDFNEAFDKVYEAAKAVKWKDKYYRKDIGAALFKRHAA